MKKYIAVIGGAGFIGSELVKTLLKSGHEVLIVDKVEPSTNVNISVIADVRDLSALTLALKGVDVVYNLAAEHRDDVSPVSLYYDVNVMGAQNVVAACLVNNIKKIVFTSSVAVYGFCDNNGDELLPIAPFNDYGQSKADAEVVFSDWFNQKPKEHELFILRPTAVFGPGNRGNIYHFFKQVSGKFSPMIGDGENKKSIAYVENVANFLEFGLENFSGHQIYNYTDSPDMTMNELVITCKKALSKNPKVGVRVPFIVGLMVGSFFDLIGKVTRKKFPISAIRVRKFCGSSQFSNAKSRAVGFDQPVSLSDGIKATIKAEFDT